MTTNLKLSLTAGTAVTASKNNGTTFSFTPTSCSANGNCPMNGNTFSYDGSWLYSWYAATAGVGTSSSSGDVDGSICPKGWRLPSTTTGWYNLLRTYSITANGDTTASVYSKMQSTPLSFTTGVSSGGTGWATNIAGSYLLSYPGTTLWYGHDETYYVYPYAGGERTIGSRVRCVAI